MADGQPAGYNPNISGGIAGPPPSGAIAGGRACGGVLPDLTIQPLINLQALAPLKGQQIVSFKGRSRASGSPMEQALGRARDEMRQCAAGAQAMYAGDLPVGTSVKAPSFGGSGSGFTLDV